jgi:hypothetical protein
LKACSKRNGPRAGGTNADTPVIDVADLFARIDVNEYGHWSLFNFRFPQCVSLQSGLNSRRTFRFNARMTPIRAIMDGPL